jgi:hypothetical protein
MKTTEFIVENSVIAQEADNMHKDHEVQMARGQMYSAAKASIEIHRLLKDISEMQGIEGWVASKLTLASEYLESVRDYLKYEAVSQQSEMMEFAEGAADYALNELILKNIKEQDPVDLTNTPYQQGKSIIQPSQQDVKDRAAVGGALGAVDTLRQTGGKDTYSYIDPKVSSMVGNMRQDAQILDKKLAVAGVGRSAPAAQPAAINPNKFAGVQDLEEKTKNKLRETATGGGSSSGSIATSMGGPTHKRSSGVPKKLGNAHKTKKVAVGKGVYDK